MIILAMKNIARMVIIVETAENGYYEKKHKDSEFRRHCFKYTQRTGKVILNLY